MYPPLTKTGLEFFNNLQEERIKYVFLCEWKGEIHGQATVNHEVASHYLNTMFSPDTGSPAVTTSVGAAAPMNLYTSQNTIQVN